MLTNGLGLGDAGGGSGGSAIAGLEARGPLQYEATLTRGGKGRKRRPVVPPTTPELFREWLDRLGYNQTAFADLLIALGDPTGQPYTILGNAGAGAAARASVLQRVHRWCNGHSRIPGEAAALLVALDALRRHQLSPFD